MMKPITSPWVKFWSTCSIKLLLSILFSNVQSIFINNYMDFQERDLNNQYNRFFTKPNDQFQCPLRDRQSKDRSWIVFLCVNIVILIAIPPYFYITHTNHNPTLNDFRGDICGITLRNRPYHYIIQSFNTPICVADCQINPVCLYKPDGVTLYTDWCSEPSTNIMASPIYGRCQIYKQQFINLLFGQLANGADNLYLQSLGACVLTICFILVISIMIFFKSVKVLLYLNAALTVCLIAFACFIYQRNQIWEPQTNLKNVIFVVFILYMLANLFKFLTKYKNMSNFNSTFCQLLIISRLKLRIIFVTIIVFILKYVVIAGQIYLATTYLSTSKIQLKNEMLFPGGLFKNYILSSNHYGLLILYIIFSLLFINFLSYLKEFYISYQYQYYFFNDKSQKCFTNCMKETGYLYKTSISLVISSYFNSFYQKLVFLAHTRYISLIFEPIMKGFEETYQTSFKFFHEYNINQRVFQGQQIENGGQISYFLIKRNYPDESTQIITSFSSNTSVLFSIGSPLIFWYFLFKQQNTAQSGFLRLQYIFFFIYYLQARLVSNSILQTFDMVIRSIIYTIAANKEMKYVQRSYYEQSFKILQQSKEVNSNKIQNIFEFQNTKGDIQENHTIIHLQNPKAQLNCSSDNNFFLKESNTSYAFQKSQKSIFKQSFAKDSNKKEQKDKSNNLKFNLNKKRNVVKGQKKISAMEILE